MDITLKSITRVSEFDKLNGLNKKWENVVGKVSGKIKEI